MKYIYFEMEDKAAIQAWLSSQPDGEWDVLVGCEADENPAQMLASCAQREGGLWLLGF
ncbi:MAG: hypothetical protein ETSY1_44390 [Candidatus Entotheonella factor]|uniref:Uncharacterized protein n=1 Tax=Entotheonella factor TaxID=1429438 RepID=W4L2G4_ENTF1|nr:MAG: hypothetical protein ETSY1_44390 [Candidatus Entotheonella factor]